MGPRNNKVYPHVIRDQKPTLDRDFREQGYSSFLILLCSKKGLVEKKTETKQSFQSFGNGIEEQSEVWPRKKWLPLPAALSCPFMPARSGQPTNRVSSWVQEGNKVIERTQKRSKAFTVSRMELRSRAVFLCLEEAEEEELSEQRRGSIAHCA